MANTVYIPQNPISRSQVGRRTMRAIVLPALAGLVILLGGLSAVLVTLNTPQTTRSQAASPGVKVSLTPPYKSGKVGSLVPVGIVLETGDDSVSAVDLYFSFDSSTIRIVGFAESENLPVILREKLDEKGSYNLTLGSNPTTPFKGTEIIGTIGVKILSETESVLSLTEMSRAASVGKPDNTLVEIADSTIVGLPSVDSSPTPTKPTPRPTVNALRVPAPSVTVSDVQFEEDYRSSALDSSVDYSPWGQTVPTAQTSEAKTTPGIITFFRNIFSSIVKFVRGY